jgi:hypothetical protein
LADDAALLDVFETAVDLLPHIDVILNILEGCVVRNLFENPADFVFC